MNSCAPGPTEVPTLAAPTLTASPAPTDTPAPTPSVTPTPFVPKAVIKIFIQSPLTGNQAIFGIDILRGAELAVQKLEGPLREQGLRVEIIAFDDQNNPEIAVSNAAEIAADSGILCGIGHYGSRPTIAAADIYHRAQLAIVAPAATSSNLTSLGYPEFNRVIAPEDKQGIAAAQFALAQGVSSVYLIGHEGENGVRNTEHFRAEASRLGIRVLGLQITAITPLNATVLVDRMMATSPDLVYVTGSVEESIPFFQAARAAGYTGLLMGIDDLNNPRALSRGGASLTEGGGFYFTIPNAPANHYPNATNFVTDFGVHYGSPPLLFAARAYDAAAICLKGIENALAANEGELPTRGQVAAAVRAITDYSGITGTYSFNRQGDPAIAEYHVYKVVSVEAANWDQNYIIASYLVPLP